MLLVVGLLACVGTATAAGSSASFSATPAGLTIERALGVAQRYEQHLGLGGVVQGCRWADRHDIYCTVVTIPLAVVDGQPAYVYEWQDDVTRSGPCSDAGPVLSRHKRHGVTVTVQAGANHNGNCFTGPLIAMSVPDSLRLIG